MAGATGRPSSRQPAVRAAVLLAAALLAASCGADATETQVQVQGSDSREAAETVASSAAEPTEAPERTSTEASVTEEASAPDPAPTSPRSPTATAPPTSEPADPPPTSESVDPPPTSEPADPPPTSAVQGDDAPPTPTLRVIIALEGLTLDEATSRLESLDAAVTVEQQLAATSQLIATIPADVQAKIEALEFVSSVTLDTADPPTG